MALALSRLAREATARDDVEFWQQRREGAHRGRLGRAALPAELTSPSVRHWLRGRLGDPTRLRFGDATQMVGCPVDECRIDAAETQFFEGLTPDEVIFHTSSTRPGNSGGALFNRWGEVLGMVTADGSNRLRDKRQRRRFLVMATKAAALPPHSKVLAALARNDSIV